MRHFEHERNRLGGLRLIDIKVNKKTPEEISEFFLLKRGGFPFCGVALVTRMENALLVLRAIVGRCGIITYEKKAQGCG